MKHILRPVEKFAKDVHGAISAFNIFVFFALLMIGGLAIDVMSVYEARTRLQVAADSAAHAALYKRVQQEPDATSLTEAVTAGKTAALAIAANEMPSGFYGTVLSASDIEFGDWDSDKQTFTANPLSDNAVRVNTHQLVKDQNGVSTFLLKLVGVSEWNVQTPSVFETFIPSCMRQGMVAQEMVDIQGNSTFDNGFCIHSNTHVKISSNNTFANNTFVTMPDDADLEIPASGYDSNPGLWRAVDENAYLIRELNELPGWIADLTAGTFDDPNTDVVEGLEMPTYLTSTVVKTHQRASFQAADLLEGRINFIDCPNSNNQLQMTSTGSTKETGKPGDSTGTTEETGKLFLQNMILVTTCQLNWSAEAQLENMIIAVDNDTTGSFNTASGMILGKDDSCASGGSTVVLTKGDFSASAGLSVYGSKVIALGDIAFTANANGIEGASFIAGGTISATSNNTMGFCPDEGIDNTFEPEYFRMVM